jgi:hypothetical protein
MPHNHSKRRTTALAIAALALASLLLAACGSSSPSSSTSTTSANAAATTSASTTTTSTGTSSTGSSGTTSTGSGTTSAGSGRRGAFASRFAALRECLKKDGVTLPERKPGQRGGFLGGGAAGGPQPPAGVSRAQYEADLKKCGGFGHGRIPGAGVGAGTRFSTPAARQALAKFAACVRANGVNLPEPNTSGKGPIFDTKGLNTGSATFRNAERKCRTDLARAFFARPGAAGGPAGPPQGAG